MQLDATSIDDSKFSKLTAHQHERFLYLSSLLERNNASSTTWKETTRKEYQRLLSIVREEQQLYRQALDCFWDGQSNTIQQVLYDKTVFDVAIVKRQNSWFSTNQAVRYGKCCQVMSLIPAALATSSVRSKKHLGMENSLSSSNDARSLIDDITSYCIVNNSATKLSKTTLPNVGTRIPSADLMKLSPDQMLEHDVLAFKLADEHHANIITSENTLQNLLQTDIQKQFSQSNTFESGLKSWIIPVSRHHVTQSTSTPAVGNTLSGSRSNPVVLDLPLSEPYTSLRDCIEHGLEEGLYQLLGSNTDNDCTGNTQNLGLLESSTVSNYNYTLLQIPSTNHSLRVLRVLVRSRAKNPCFHVKLELFPQRGKEEFTIFERAVWVLDHLLHDRKNDENTHFPCLALCRINPSHEIVSWEQPSLAHAVAEHSQWLHRAKSDADKISSVESQWRLLSHLLGAVLTIGNGKHIMCFPSRQDVIGHASSALATSIHPVDSNGNLEPFDIIDRTGDMLLQSDSLQRCRRFWQWSTANCVPYTFPPAGSSSVA